MENQAHTPKEATDAQKEQPPFPDIEISDIGSIGLETIHMNPEDAQRLIAEFQQKAIELPAETGHALAVATDLVNEYCQQQEKGEKRFGQLTFTQRAVLVFSLAVSLLGCGKGNSNTETQAGQKPADATYSEKLGPSHDYWNNASGEYLRNKGLHPDNIDQGANLEHVQGTMDSLDSASGQYVQRQGLDFSTMAPEERDRTIRELRERAGQVSRINARRRGIEPDRQETDQK